MTMANVLASSLLCMASAICETAALLGAVNTTYNYGNKFPLNRMYTVIFFNCGSHLIKISGSKYQKYLWVNAAHFLHFARVLGK